MGRKDYFDKKVRIVYLNPVMFKDIRSKETDRDLRAEAFEEFKLIAAQEQANGAENLSLFRLVPKFSTAPKDETDSITVCMRNWSRNGDQAALLRHGAELYHGGYDPALYETGGALHTALQRRFRHS